MVYVEGKDNDINRIRTGRGWERTRIKVDKDR